MRTWMKLVPFVVGMLLIVIAASPLTLQAGKPPNPPEQTVKLIFIHHSTGENWLTDGYGDLGRALGENNYYVSDTNYGWGPDSIGDRTDIPNWTEWFASESTPVFMQALFNESGQHASYTRTLSDPGGENEIVMFKSCFPNSALEGAPDDPPGDYEELTVSGAKYVYNTILQYFAARPDKLFIVVTAPPLSDPAHAGNARAFNAWLVNDWLQENEYALNNVFVFDFYNVLTDPNAHHRYSDGQIEHILGEQDILYYPSEDDHPSQAGSRKATEEFVPLLNVYYRRWKEYAPAPSAPVTATESQGESQRVASSTPGWIDDFDANRLPTAAGWQGFYDEATSTSLTCEVQPEIGHTGNSLHFDFDIAANSWGTCAAFFDTPRSWNTADALSFYFRSSQQPLLFDVDVYTGSTDHQATYVFTVEAPPESVTEWYTLQIQLDAFQRASWEENAGAWLTPADEIVGLAFGVTALGDAPNAGEIWVDDLHLTSLAPEAEGEPPKGIPTLAPPDAPTGNRPLFPCTAGMLPLLFLGFIEFHRRTFKG